MTDELMLTKRERQIMAVLHELGDASAKEIQDRIPSPPGYSTVRKLLEILEGKGHVRHRREGRRYVYSASTSTVRAGRSALRRVIATYFGGSPERAVAALLDESDVDVPDETMEEIENLIRAAREEDR